MGSSFIVCHHLSPFFITFSLFFIIFHHFFIVFHHFSLVLSLCHSFFYLFFITFYCLAYFFIVYTVSHHFFIIVHNFSSFFTTFSSISPSSTSTLHKLENSGAPRISRDSITGSDMPSALGLVSS